MIATIPYSNDFSERIAVRGMLARKSNERAIGALMDSQATERKIEREAMYGTDPTAADGAATVMRSTKRTTTAGVALGIARRRDALTRLAAPMSGDDVQTACRIAVLAAKVPEAQRDDVAQDLATHIYAKHGRSPKTSDVGRAWLTQCAYAFAARARDRDERAIGMRGSSDQLKSWRAQDRDKARAAVAMAAAASGDPVHMMAERTAAPEPMDEPTLERICGALSGPLTAGQLAAVRLACAEDHRSRRALTSTERVQWSNARRVLRFAFPTREALRLAYASPVKIASELVGRCQRQARQNAKVATRGGGGMPRQAPPLVAILRTPVIVPPRASTPIARPARMYGPAAIRLSRQDPATRI